MKKEEPKPKKQRLPRKDFAERLAEKLEVIGEVDCGSLSDKSCRWVKVKVGKLSIEFAFDMKGEVIDNIGLYQEVWQCVDQKQIVLFSQKKTTA